MTNKPRWAKLQTTDIQRIQGISKTQTQNIRTVSLSCWWPCFWIWIMQSYWIYSEFLMTGETLYYPTTSLTDRWDPLLSYHLSTLTGETLYYPTTSVHWQVRPFTILLPQYTDRWDTLLSYHLSTLTGETLYYPTTSVHWQVRPFTILLPQWLTGETLYYPTTSVTDRWDPLLSCHLSDWQVRPFTILLPQWLTGETLYYHTTSVTDRWDPLPSYYLSTLTCDCLLSYYLSDWLVTVYYPTTSVSWAQSVLWQICMCQPVHW